MVYQCHYPTRSLETARGAKKSPFYHVVATDSRNPRDGKFNEEIVPVEVPQRKGATVKVDRDEYPRAGTTVEKLTGLKPAFIPTGTVTAGNASGINDGASALVVASEKWATDRGRTPLARVVSYASIGVEPMMMVIGPAKAIPRAVDRAGLKMGNKGAEAAMAAVEMAQLQSSVAEPQSPGKSMADGRRSMAKKSSKGSRTATKKRR